MHVFRIFGAVLFRKGRHPSLHVQLRQIGDADRLDQAVCSARHIAFICRDRRGRQDGRLCLDVCVERFAHIDVPVDAPLFLQVLRGLRFAVSFTDPARDTLVNLFLFPVRIILCMIQDADPPGVPSFSRRRHLCEPSALSRQHLRLYHHRGH